MENKTMNEEFHKPFINSLIVVALVTVFAMVSSRFLVDYYMDHNLLPSPTIEYSSQKSQDQTISALE